MAEGESRCNVVLVQVPIVDVQTFRERVLDLDGLKANKTN